MINYYIKLVYLIVYMILHYLNFFLKKMPTLLSYIPLDAPTLHPNYKFDTIHFISNLVTCIGNHLKHIKLTYLK